MGKLLNTIWYDRTIRTQLLIAIGVINLAALVVAGMVWVANARYATRVEMEASVELAKNFARVAIQSLSPDGTPLDLSKKVDQLSSRLRIGNLRHVRIFIADASGRLVQLSPAPDAVRDPSLPPPAPAWFQSLVEPEVMPRTLSVLRAGPGSDAVVMVEQPVPDEPKIWTLGTVVIAGEPADEIAEVWFDVSSLVLVLGTLDLLVLATLYIVLGRMLDPMANVARGLVRLEDGDYGARLTPPRVKELGAITACFNRLAETLDRARSENGRLYGQLITVQEDERREIANELHDEASPCLFGIMANAMSVQKLTERRRDRRTADIRGHVGEILRVTERLKMMNRVMLKKLRPVSLGRVSLSELAGDLLSELQRRYPEVDITPSIRTRSTHYGEAIDLAVYRCIQEGVTNAIRHGRADSVRVDLLEKRGLRGANGAAKPTLQLLIQDDGRGILPDTQLGFGLTAMRERIHALGGSCAIQSAPSQGAMVRVIIPITAATTVKAGAPGYAARPANFEERIEAS
jgi:two-component system, NarL family, sensor histidine kinase UhpB